MIKLSSFSDDMFAFAPASPANIRQKKVCSAVHRALENLFQELWIPHNTQHLLGNSGLAYPSVIKDLGFFITTVNSSKDLSLLSVMVHPQEAPQSDKSKTAPHPSFGKILQALTHMAPMIQRHLQKKIALRFSPKIRFVQDQHTDEVQKILSLLDKLKD